MKIAMLGHKGLPSRAGGVEVVVQHLSTEMARRGHAVTCYNRPGFSPRAESYRGVRLVTVPALGKGGMEAVTASFFACLGCAFGTAEVVHIHAEGPAFFSFLPRLAGKRVVVTIHGLDWKREKWRGSFASRFIKWGEEMAVRYAHCIVVLSHSMQRYFLESYGRETVLIPNGVEIPEHLEPEEIGKLGLQKDGYVLFLGRLVPEKGVHTLIHAYGKVKTDKKLVIAGDSSHTDDYVKELKRLAQGDKRVVFAGFVQGRLLGELYSNAFVYVLPSELEGMPVGLLEAMSHGCCCLVSDIPACTEVLGTAGISVPAGNVDALAWELQRLCDGSVELSEYRAAARQACHRYDWEEIVERTLECYREDSADQ